MSCGENCGHHSDKNCIEIVPIFNNLTFDEMMEVASITTAKDYDKGEFIYTQGDIGEKLYVIHKGRVKISRISSNGKEQVIRVIGPGEFLGELSLFSPLPMADNAEVLEKTSLCIIEGHKLKKIINKYPTIAFKVMEEMSQRLERAENLIEDINLHSVETRLAQGLLKMANDKNEVVLNMTKGDFASQLGMSQETLSRKLTLFQEQGIIKQIGNRKIVLLSLDELEII
ncbi:Crp/Fnr family transcriptional regulator [Tissierella sp. Yu-01]|uniref:Crp/Fnr family transcriptional regulator n=1 Tax=Tissierella sp. Yu-01 TaxID=3035694 RepID=UPI00240D32DD|nr:Crp/Fnr family transcriptional regulator [Tissierella sp. Yu-01]WFA08145.1 Crp/Fnr family transcriptional regulator [Tissierella sp. Yu-01]